MNAVRQYEHEVGEILSGDRLLPVAIIADASDAGYLADAIAAGGLRSVEVTFRTDAAPAAIAAIARHGGLLVGAGTIVTPAQVDQAAAAGAQFIVSPGFGPAVVRRCQEVGLPVFPGVATPTEIQMALDAGLDTVKFFPAEQLGGMAMLRALTAPFPSVRFIPTGGVTTANLAQYLSNPAVMAVGGTWMVAPDLLAARNWAEVTSRTAAGVRAVAALGSAPC